MCRSPHASNCDRSRGHARSGPQPHALDEHCAAILTGKALGGATVATLQSLVIPHGLHDHIVGAGAIRAVEQVQSAMPLVQLVITPTMLLLSLIHISEP